MASMQQMNSHTDSYNWVSEWVSV